MSNSYTMAALVGAVLILPVPAAASCADRATLEAALLHHWGEVPRFGGVTADGRLLEIFLSPSGSWSAVASLPDGTACIVGGGEGGIVLAPPRPPGEPS